jgi:hypothetical protein
MSALAALFKSVDTSVTRITCNYNVVEVLIAIAQTSFGAFTLYKTRGDQIK